VRCAPTDPVDLRSRRGKAWSRERVLSLTLLGVLCALVGVLSASEPDPDWWMLLTLIMCMIVAEHRDRLFEDETSMSGSIVVALASVVAFHDSAFLLGPILCGASAGLYWPHLREGAWSKIVINAATMALSALAAAAVFSVAWSPSLPMFLDVLVAGLAATLAYWAVNCVMLAGATAVIGRAPFWPMTIELVRSETEMLGFALAGALCGLLFIEVGIWAGALALVLVLAAVDVLVISRPRPSSERTKHRGLAAVLARAAALLIGGGCAFAVADAAHPFAGLVAGIASAVLVMTVLTTAILHGSLGSWDARLAGGVAVADLPYAIVAVIAGVVAASIEPAIGVAVACVGLIGTGGLLAWRRHHVVAEPQIDDTELLAMLELARAERRSAPGG
jgi:hypothetical protein